LVILSRIAICRKKFFFWPSGSFQGTLAIRAATLCHPNRAAPFKTHDLDQGDRLLPARMAHAIKARREMFDRLAKHLQFFSRLRQYPLLD
jgi:hypothetical protein